MNELTYNVLVCEWWRDKLLVVDVRGCSIRCALYEKTSLETNNQFGHHGVCVCEKEMRKNQPNQTNEQWVWRIMVCVCEGRRFMWLCLQPERSAEENVCVNEN